jgi:hypothetical protein
VRVRSHAVALGAGITTALLVAVLVIEAIAVEFSAIVGLPIGLLAGGITTALVSRRYDRVARPVRALFDGSAGFGYTVVLLLAGRYVGRLGLRSVVTFERLVAAAVVVAILTGLASWLLDRLPDANR